mgnify:CR=1 FL=1
MKSDPEISNQTTEKPLNPVQDTKATEKSTSFPTSATTSDEPAFGWSDYAERVNGRFAMLGFLSVILIEILTSQTFIKWSGIIN